MSVYFAKSGSKWKIGRSRNPEARIKSLVIGSAAPIVIEATWDVDDDVEKALHARLEHRRSHGEWFDSCPEIDAIVSAVQSKDEAAICRALGVEEIGDLVIQATQGLSFVQFLKRCDSSPEIFLLDAASECRTFRIPKSENDPPVSIVEQVLTAMWRGSFDEHSVLVARTSELEHDFLFGDDAGSQDGWIVRFFWEWSKAAGRHFPGSDRRRIIGRVCACGRPDVFRCRRGTRCLVPGDVENVGAAFPSHLYLHCHCFPDVSEDE